MVFNSFGFLIFLPLVVCGHFLLPPRFRWIFLLIASYYFYISWNVQLIWLILFTTAVSYGAALLLDRTANQTAKKCILTGALVCCLGVLVFFKYFDFLSLSVTNALNAVGLTVPEYTLNLILPVGISFYTFQTLSYVIDVYRGSMPAEKHFGYYALYVSFFPQLVAGPIERPDSLIPQLRKETAFSFANLCDGIKIMLVGFVKKVVVADTVAVYINAVYNQPQQATGLSVLIATLLFAVQIYCDFAGYTDIAIGCARIMGIRLMKNFNNPYSAKTIKEFWSRWHISLSSWLKDYIYIPLGGNRCSKGRHLFNLFVVFLVSGVWHGAAWTFILWGVLHAVYQIVGDLTLPGRNRFWAKRGLTPDAKAVALPRRFVTFLLVDFAWMLFRANSFADLGVLVKKLFGDWQLSGAYLTASLNSLTATSQQLLICGLCVAVMVLCDKVYLDDTLTRRAPRQAGFGAFLVAHKNTLYLSWLVAVAWLLLLSGSGASSFIYFQF